MPRLELLGGATLKDEAGLITGPAARRHPLALLALLATAPGQKMSRGKLVGFLWPEATEEVARNRLTTTVYEIRNDLGAEVLASAGDDLLLNRDALACDVLQLEEALEADDPRRAVELYDGPFLDGFDLKGAPAFEKWLDGQRERLRQAYHRALEALAGAAEQRGEPAVAAEWWRERAEADAYDSRIVRRRMEALEAAGNRAAALRCAREHAHLLREELGTEPGADVLELAAELRGSASSEVRTTDPAAEGDAPTERGTPRRESADGGPSPAGTGEPRPRRQAAAPPTTRGEPGLLRRRLVLSTLVAVGLIATLTAGGWYLFAAGGSTNPGEEAPGTPEGSIAVLPFEAVGEDDPDELTAGLHADLLARLSGVPGLSVTSATSVRRYRGSERSIGEIAGELGVRWVLEGSVQRSGDRLRVHAQLIDARSDSHAWADTYEVELTPERLFRVQGRIARRIVASLATRLGPADRERLARVPTRDLEAHRLYVQGRRLLDRRTEPAMRRALDYFRRAIERDSTYAPAWAGLADAAGIIPSYGYAPPEDAPEQERAARRALELDPELAEAHASMAQVHMARRNYAAAVRSLQRAVELKPSYHQAHGWLAAASWHAGRPDAALEHARRAAALSPHAPLARYGLAKGYLLAGEYRKALREARRTPEIETEYPTAHLEGWILYHLGRLEEAKALLREAPGDQNRAVLALAHVASGDTARARGLLARLEGEGAPPFWVGLVRAGLGDTEGAFEAFRRVDAWHRSASESLRYLFPGVLGPLREDPRYDELIRRVNRYRGLAPDGSFPPGTVQVAELPGQEGPGR